jgi:apolipoprotein N-acyltransferase
MFLPIFSAILSIVGFNTSWYFLIFIALTPFFLFFIYEKHLWKLLAGTFLFRLIFAFGTVYFVIDPILYFLSIIIFLGLPISFYLIRKFFSPLWAVILLPILWVFWDYLESQYTLLPMTLAMLGNPLAESPFLGLAKFGGIVSLTFFAGFINLLFALIILLKSNKKLLKYLIVSIIFIFAAGWWISYFAISGNKASYALKKNTLNIALLSVDKSRNNLNDSLATLSLESDTDLLVIPEGLYKNDLENSEEIIDFYKKTVKKLGVNFTAVVLRKDDGENYKSAILFSPNGGISDVYDKNFLTITSENWPFGNWRPFYFNSYLKKASPEERRRAVFDTNYQYKKGTPSLLGVENFKFASPICVEFHYPGYVKDLAKLNPDFILHNSNNDWINRGLGQYLKFTNNLRKIYTVWLGKPILVNGIRDYAGVFYPDGASFLKYPKQDFILTNVKIRL